MVAHKLLTSYHIIQNFLCFQLALFIVGYLSSLENYGECHPFFCSKISIPLLSSLSFSLFRLPLPFLLASSSTYSSSHMCNNQAVHGHSELIYLMILHR